MDATSTGNVRPRLTQNLLVMSRRSGLSSSFSVETVRGSRVIPQMGQFPGSLRTICGCMGQVYSPRPWSFAAPPDDRETCFPERKGSTVVVVICSGPLCKAPYRIASGCLTSHCRHLDVFLHPPRDNNPPCC